MSSLHSPGDIIADRYRITATLGKPNKSNTYVAEDFVKNRLIAVKAISLQQMTDWKELELLERQAKVLAGIDHPAIPKYLEYFHVDTARDRRFYLIQQLKKGNSLAELVSQGWRSNEAEVKNIALQILEILEYLHQQTPAVIHRDIQPCNLLRGSDGYISLVDFGSVKAPISGSPNYSTTFVGTYGYIPPEQYHGKACFASDLYSSGASLLFVLTGKSPDEFPQEQMKIHFRGSVQISAHFANWLEKMLDPSPKTRFQTASEAIAALRRQKELAPSSNRKTQSGKPTSQHRKKPSTAEIPREKPVGSRVIVKRSNGRLAIEIPIESSASGSATLRDLFNRWHRLEIYPRQFTISRGYIGFQNALYEGKTRELIKAELRVDAGFWGETKHSLLLWEGVTAHNFASELTSVEKEWLADEINDFLNDLEVLRRLEKLIDES